MLIGICGKAGSGKDTVANQILRHENFARHSLADPIKQMLSVIGVNCENREKKELIDNVFGASPRKMAQTLGTEWGRVCINEDIWLNIAIDRYLQLEKKGMNLVIPDVRFYNEVSWIREEGVLIHVVRPDVKEVEAHSSENQINLHKNDKLIDNDSTIAELEARVNLVMEKILESK